LAHAFETAKCGDSGDTGDKPAKSLRQLANPPPPIVTAPSVPVVTAVTPRAGEAAVTTVTSVTQDSGDKHGSAIAFTVQAHPRSVTAVTAVPRDIPSPGACVVERLRSMMPPEDFGAEAWRQLLLDSDAFLQRWAERSELLGWSDKDLLGVHPRAPAVRFDAMGLLLLIRGGEVVELNEYCAVIRSPGGALLVYRKHSYVGAVVLAS